MVVVSLASAALLAAPTMPAAAEPGEDAGKPPTLKEQLDAANRGFIDAQATLDASRTRQVELGRRLDETQKRLDALSESANTLAASAYRNNNLRTMSALLSSASPDTFVDRATLVKTMATRNDRQLREYARLRKQLADNKTSVDNEVKLQEQQVAEMNKRRADAEKALAATGGGQKTTAPAGARPASAAAAPKVNGKWPAESCTVDDPTTSGCLTPRTLHALRQAKAAGFTRFVSCYRPGGPYEHPKGRACDFSSEVGGFGGVASGGDRLYGNNLAAFLVRNADRLGVLYVIWFKQIWTPAAGWHSYGAGYGDPSSDHTNHIHLSVY